MHKLVILIGALEDWQTFENQWPNFLHLVERMPGLRREATSRVESFLYGDTPFTQMHELFFDTQAELEQALSSDEGRAAGKLLQHITGGKISLFVADYKEDYLENILKFRPRDDEGG